MENFYSSKDYCSTAQKANVASSYTSVYNVCVCSLFWYFLNFCFFWHQNESKKMLLGKFCFCLID